MAEQPISTITDAHLYALSHLVGPPQSRKIGTHVDEDGKEHEVWQHVFKPPGSTSLEELDALIDQVKQLAEQQEDTAWHFPLSGKMHFRFQPLTKQARRLERWKKIRRRQRRAQQRKLCRK